MPRARTTEAERVVALRPDGAARIGVVADTHSAPHPRTHEILAKLAPDAIVHAGDVGDLAVLDGLAAIAPVFAVRGNIDGRAHLPDVLTLDVKDGGDVLLRAVVLHIGVDGPRLRADALRLAQAKDAGLVVCGHSHVPLVARDRGVAIFNPGSCGPRRFHLPIVLGVIDVTRAEVTLAHVDCETGDAWKPTRAREAVTSRST